MTILPCLNLPSMTDKMPIIWIRTRLLAHLDTSRASRIMPRSQRSSVQLEQLSPLVRTHWVRNCPFRTTLRAKDMLQGWQIPEANQMIKTRTRTRLRPNWTSLWSFQTQWWRTRTESSLKLAQNSSTSTRCLHHWIRSQAVIRMKVTITARSHTEEVEYKGCHQLDEMPMQCIYEKYLELKTALRILKDLTAMEILQPLQIHRTKTMDKSLKLQIQTIVTWRCSSITVVSQVKIRSIGTHLTRDWSRTTTWIHLGQDSSKIRRIRMGAWALKCFHLRNKPNRRITNSVNHRWAWVASASKHSAIRSSKAASEQCSHRFQRQTKPRRKISRSTTAQQGQEEFRSSHEARTYLHLLTCLRRCRTIKTSLQGEMRTFKGLRQA